MYTHARISSLVQLRRRMPAKERWWKPMLLHIWPLQTYGTSTVLYDHLWTLTLCYRHRSSRSCLCSFSDENWFWMIFLFLQHLSPRSYPDQIDSGWFFYSCSQWTQIDPQQGRKRIDIKWKFILKSCLGGKQRSILTIWNDLERLKTEILLYCNKGEIKERYTQTRPTIPEELAKYISGILKWKPRK